MHFAVSLTLGVLPHPVTHPLVLLRRSPRAGISFESQAKRAPHEAPSEGGEKLRHAICKRLDGWRRP